MPDVTSQLADDNRLVQKHGTQILAVADYSAAVPTSWFAAPVSGRVLPNALPSGFKNLGYISTDGITSSTDISTSETMMVQSLEPVRSDVDSMTRTLAVTLGEAGSAWAQALAQQVPVAQWATAKTDPWEYHDGGRTEFPYYRLYILTQDGIGDSALYRTEFAYRAKITDLGDRSLQRSDAEMLDLTFTCYVDPIVGRSYTKASSGLYIAQ